MVAHPKSRRNRSRCKGLSAVVAALGIASATRAVRGANNGKCECIHPTDPRFICAPKAHEGVIEPSVARRIRDHAEEVGNKSGWTRERDDGFESRFVSSLRLPQETQREIARAYEKIISMTREQCVIDGHLMFEDEEFYVVKYDAGMKSVSQHQDHKHVSFIASLNELSEYEGGGNVFGGLSFSAPHGGVHHLEDHKEKPLEVGGVVVHGARVWHASEDVRSGTRYVLVGTAHVNKSCCFKVERFMTKWITILLVISFVLVMMVSGTTEWLRKKSWKKEHVW